jgi:alkanesulfonate monooxygenase SsuD/methylene tetrahydromethanopterin reductase-like flavin-dependent oxidoreductase (luciferase family)
VPWTRRGRILDEQLRIWEQVWARSPVSFDGEFFSFEDVYLEPKPTRPTGPAMWFGGDRVHGAIVDRLVRYGTGYHPLGRVTDEDVATLRAALAEAGRSIDDLELVGGTRVEFPGDDVVARLPEALEEIPRQQALGFTTFVVKPSIFIDHREDHPAFCREVIERVAALTS